MVTFSSPALATTNLAVQVTDDDVLGIGVSTSALTITEGGAGSFTTPDTFSCAGVTFASVCEHLLVAFPLIKALKTAVLWQKAASVVKPDYVVTVLATNPWIHQPFERYDTVKLPELVEKWSVVPNK
jgi:hypothetical protein